MGKGHYGAILTVIDRKNRLSKITYVKSKASSKVHHALINVFKGLLRQFLPKYQSLDKVTQQKLQKIEDRLNLRPRKILNYLSPIEVVSKNDTIALHC